MKISLIFPPQWTPFAPPLALPVLTSYLKKFGNDVQQIDANAGFYNYIFSNAFINQAKNEINNFIAACEQVGVTSLSIQDQTRYGVTQKIISELQEFWPELENLSEKSLEILKDPELFYNPFNLTEAVYHIKNILLTLGLAYFPSDILLNYYSNANYKLNIDSIINIAEDSKTNIFLKYYQEKLIDSIKSYKPDVIGISIGCNTQIIAGLTLAKLVKSTLPSVHVTIGGNAFTRLTDVIQSKPIFFDYFADSLIYGEGEKALLELATALESGKDLSGVPNLLYKIDETVIINDECDKVNLNDLPFPDFSGLDFNDYLAGNIILPVQSSRGCYWKKCTFCDHHYGHKYSVKSPSRMLEELSYLSKTYNIKHFYFIDETISANYMNNLSKKIIESGLYISWYSCARAENGYTQEIAENAKKSGLKMLLWGIESFSDRILTLINKGSNKEKYLEVLNYFYNSGVWNHCFFFFGFPSETMNDAFDSINTILTNTSIINSYGLGTFSIGKYSPIGQDPDKFFIKEIKHSDEELSTSTNDFETTEGMNKEEVNAFVQVNTEFLAETYKFPLWMSIGGYKDYLFLYLDKYGHKVLTNSPDETVEAFGSNQ